MAVIQCKMCGGTVDLPQGVTSGECPYCGSLTTFPKINNEHKEQLYSRAEHFRRQNDFDKAVSAYEALLNEDSSDPEAYWGLVLSRFGIEYVEDPVSHERIPTCHRVQFESILADADYRMALENSSGMDREIYEKEAQRIAEIQKCILAISSQEKPFDVFICYKETTEGGTRTNDSVVAQEIYYQLVNAGYKVFFARITLEDKLGQQYEPYIFAALNSAKVMLVIGSKKEYFEAVWVRNEWSRFLALMKKDRSKMLIPCYKDMDAYDIPQELSMLQSQDMSKIGFIQDLLRGISKVARTGTAESPAAIPVSDGKNPLLRRAQLFLENGDFPAALDFCEKALNTEPENGEVYFCRLLAELKLSDEAELVKVDGLENNKTFNLAQRFADDGLKSKLDGILRVQAEARKAVQEILQTSVMREKQLLRAANAENALHGLSDLYSKLWNCRWAESNLREKQQLSLEEAMTVKAASEEVLAQVGDLTGLERLAKEKRARCRKITLIVAGVVVLLIIIVTVCNVISESRYINAELTKARAARDASQWSEVLIHANNILAKDRHNTEAISLIGTAETQRKAEEARRQAEARR